MENKIKSNGKTYTEVRMDSAGIDRNYKHPLTRTFQYEYALFRTVKDLFASVHCNSMCTDKLRMYFLDLPGKAESTAENDAPVQGTKKGRTREAFLGEVRMLVERDVAEKVNFPMMHACAANAYIREEKDGTHIFVFTDEIYGFALRLRMQENGHPEKIEVCDLTGYTLIAENTSPIFAGMSKSA